MNIFTVIDALPLVFLICTVVMKDLSCAAANVPCSNMQVCMGMREIYVVHILGKSYARE